MHNVSRAERSHAKDSISFSTFCRQRVSCVGGISADLGELDNLLRRQWIRCSAGPLVRGVDASRGHPWTQRPSPELDGPHGGLGGGHIVHCCRCARGDTDVCGIVRGRSCDNVSWVHNCSCAVPGVVPTYGMSPDCGATANNRLQLTDLGFHAPCLRTGRANPARS